MTSVQGEVISGNSEIISRHEKSNMFSILKPYLYLLLSSIILFSFSIDYNIDQKSDHISNFVANNTIDIKLLDTTSFEYFLLLFKSRTVIPDYLCKKFLRTDDLPNIYYETIEEVSTKGNIKAVIYYTKILGIEEYFYLATFSNEGDLVSSERIAINGGDLAFYRQSNYEFIDDHKIITKVMVYDDEIVIFGEEDEDYFQEFPFAEERPEFTDIRYEYFKIMSNGKIEKLTDIEKNEYQRRYKIVSLKYLTQNALNRYTKEELRIMRNEIFAAHGYIFKTKKIREYFLMQEWYIPKYENVDSLLTHIEKVNISNIKKMENK